MYQPGEDEGRGTNKYTMGIALTKAGKKEAEVDLMMLLACRLRLGLMGEWLMMAVARVCTCESSRGGSRVSKSECSLDGDIDIETLCTA